MNGRFLNQKPCILSWPGVFQFDFLFSVVLSKSMCISVLGPSSSPSSSLVILFIHSAFLLCFLVAIFSSKIVRFLWHPVVGMFSCLSLPIVDRMYFRCFWKSCFVCIVLPFVDVSLIFLLSPAHSGLYPQVVLLFFLVLPVPICSSLFQHLSYFLSFWLVFVVFLENLLHQISPGFSFFASAVHYPVG